MNHEAAFMREIIARPEEDGPRLLLADYLDEHSQPERAEFIRVQVRLADMEPPDDWYEDPQCRCDLCQLTRREQELLAARQKRPDGSDAGANSYLWCGPTLFVLSVVGNAVWRRGFVEELTCTAADFLAHGPAIVRATPLREVRLSNKGPIDLTTEGFPSDWRRDELPFRWIHGRHGCNAPQYIPAKLCRGFPRQWVDDTQYYRTREEAMAALSTACITWAKSTAASAPETAASH